MTTQTTTTLATDTPIWLELFGDGAATRITWADFVRDNAEMPDLLVEIEAALLNGSYYETDGGGDCVPFVVRAAVALVAFLAPAVALAHDGYGAHAHLASGASVSLDGGGALLVGVAIVAIFAAVRAIVAAVRR